jgi:hypothetical protein
LGIGLLLAELGEKTHGLKAIEQLRRIMPQLKDACNFPPDIQGQGPLSAKLKRADPAAWRYNHQQNKKQAHGHINMGLKQSIAVGEALIKRLER